MSGATIRCNMCVLKVETKCVNYKGVADTQCAFLPVIHTASQCSDPIRMCMPSSLQAAEFSGRCTLEQSDDADLKRAGYCVASSKVQHIGDYFDLSGYSQLVYNVKGDGRTYLANVRVDSLAGTGGDIWQAPFTTR